MGTSAALKRAENLLESNNKHDQLSDAYYVLGDIHDFNGAPKAAIKSYQKSIELSPSSGSWRELRESFRGTVFQVQLLSMPERYRTT